MITAISRLRKSHIVTLCVVFTLFGSLIVFPSSASASSSTSVSSLISAKSECAEKRIIVITTDDLRWNEITQQSTPYLHTLTSKSYVASLTPGRVKENRTIASTFATINAGSRTIDAKTFPSVARVNKTKYTADIESLKKTNQDGPYDAELGTLGTTLAKNDVSLALLDPRIKPGSSVSNASLLSVIDNRGNADHVFTRATSDITTYLNTQKQSVLIAHIDRKNLPQLDASIQSTVEQYKNSHTSVLVIGAPTFTGTRNLTVAALSVGTSRGFMASATRQRDGLIELIDIMPTILDQLCLTTDVEHEGSPSTLVTSPHTFSHDLNRLVHENTQSKLRSSLNGYAVKVFLIFSVALILALLFLQIRKRMSWATMMLTPALAAASLFAALYIVNIFGPLTMNDWKSELALTTLAIFLALLALEKFTGKAVPVYLTAFAALMLFDVATDNPFQANAAFGYSFTMNSRSYGFSNIGSAVFSLCVIYLCFYARRLWETKYGKYAGGFFLFAMLMVIGYPSLGADVGGLISSAPAFGITFLFLGGYAIKKRTLFIGAILSILAVFGVGLIDFLRPEKSRTHLGRLFHHVVDQGPAPFIEIVSRKAGAMLSSFTSYWCLIMVCCIAGLYLLYKEKPFPRHISIASALLAIFGTFFNDAGTLVGGSISLLTICMVLIDLNKVELLPTQKDTK